MDIPDVLRCYGRYRGGRPHLLDGRWVYDKRFVYDGHCACHSLHSLWQIGNAHIAHCQGRHSLDLGELYKRYSGTLIGDYIGYFLAKEGMDTVEKKALFYGLQALLETGSRR